MSASVTTFTGRVALWIGDTALTAFTEVEVEHDLDRIASTFRVVCLDEARLRQALAVWLPTGQPIPGPLAPGARVKLVIDSAVVLVGWIDVLDLEWDGEAIRCEISGRDVNGDLVDCMPLPEGPAEFNNATLLTIANAVCAPFHIPVYADVDPGAPFVRFTFHPHETAMSALEKAARERAILLTGDGVGGLRLTRGGQSRAPTPLTVGDNVQRQKVRISWQNRFSHNYVKGQSAGGHDGTALVGPDTTPGGEDIVPQPFPGGSRVIMTGLAIDPEIARSRYRPTVRMVRTQSGMDSVQVQAEWMARVNRGQGDGRRYTVLDWRAGPNRDLWRVNQRTQVYDPYAPTETEMLIAGVRYLFDARGARTELRVVGITAYDRINEPDRHRQRRRAATGPGRIIAPSGPPPAAP